MGNHPADNKADRPLVSMGDPLQAVMHFGCDPAIDPDFESLFLCHDRPRWL
jgi:hypothetical protein